MSEVIGKGVIEVSADATKLKAGIADAKKSLKGLGIAASDATKGQSASIDRYIKSLGIAAVTTGKTGRELELYKLSLRGANAAQLKAADSALRMVESYERGQVIGQRVRAGFLAIGAAAATGLIAAAVAFDQLIKKAGDFQDMAEKTGDTAENIASLAVAAGTAGNSMDEISNFAIKLNKNLTGVDDESSKAGAAIKALGLDLDTLKKLSAADQLESIAKALAKFDDQGPDKGNALEAIAKGGAQLLPFLKELSQEGGRQVILTEKQIKLADEYSDRQAKLRAEISLQAQAIATELLPAVNDFTSTIAELAKDQQFAATAADLLKGALSAAVSTFQTIAIVASDVGFVFKGVGREIGAIAAQLVALARLDFAGFRAISDAVREDGVRARAELDRFQAKLLAIGQPTIKPDASAGDFARADRLKANKPKLKFDGAEKKGGKGTADQEAKSQLALDLDQIRKASEATINTFSNAEKIMEALRSAGLADESEYYAAKLGFLRLNSIEQEAALQKEIERLQAEKLSGKAKIDNARQIADAEAKLAKVRENAAASETILSIQTIAAKAKEAQAYRDAEDAAKDYLDTIRRAQARDIQGFGIGNQERDRSAGRAQIEDKFSEQRRALDKSRRDAEFSGSFGPEAQKKYDEELERIRRFQAVALSEYDIYYADRLALEKDFALGASEALINYFNDSQKIAQQIESAFTNAFQSLEDALVNFVKTGKLDFKSLADSIISDLIRIQIKSQITGPLASALSGGGGIAGIIGSVAGMFGGAGGGSGYPDSLPTRGGRAIGGPVSPGGLYPVNEGGRPELLKVAGKQYLMTGSQSGTVTPNPSTGGSPTYVTVQVTPPPGSNSESASQWGRVAGRHIQRSMVRG